MTLPLSQFHYQDMHGEYDLYFRDRIMTARVTGVGTVKLATSFVKQVECLLPQIKDDTWGYLGILTDYVAVTEEARKIVLSSHADCIKAGCRVDAYIMNIAMAEHQLAKTRELVGIKTLLKDQVFQHEEEATVFIREVLKKIDGKRKGLK